MPFLNDSDPKVGSTVHGSPAVVKLWMTRHIKSGVSTVQVFDAAGREVDNRDAKVDPDDPTLLAVSVPKLASGTYKVTWTAVCIDTHMTHGSFTFDVAGP